MTWRRCGFGVMVATLCGLAPSWLLAEDAPKDRPTGPYATWTPDQQARAKQATARNCMLLPTVFDNYHGPKEAMTEASMGMLMACFAHHMPPDWPDRQTVLTDAAAHLEKAKRLDPGLPQSLPQVSHQ